MENVGRNDPCPCGSGRKYKRCCFSIEKKRQNAGLPTGLDHVPTAKCFVTDLDKLSNSVITLIESGDLDTAEATCTRLQREFPDQIDGIWRLAMVQEAKGDRAGAARNYRAAADFMRSHDGFDQEGTADMTEAAKRLEADP